ncbi:hypothetical protein RV15_GL002593 [Enterococcus silesiacus]|uniref:Carnitine dehydratase n=2 Tax=Enterococcus silesiacus TaxID=332949 RepID=A0AA91JML5_9ENTE|nr:hypothetical protein RV15_GL002593 [Enterococcus silesiacus]
MMERKLPLEGIKVVELGTHVAVPNATRFMADWGAEVIKVEGVRGEEWRVIGNSYYTPVADDENPIFTVQNANKEFIAIDLKNPDGMEIMKKLIREADIFISNVRLNSLKKMKLDYEAVKPLNPQIIYCHFTGFGYEGPDRNRPGFDMAAYWARSGAMSDWVSKGDYPIKPPGGFGDATVSANICSGILAALYARTQSGKGTFLTSSLYSSAIWYNSTGIVSTQEKYGNVYPKDKNQPVNPFSHIYKCKDEEYVIITVLDYNNSWEKMVTMLGFSEYLNDERFNTILAVRENMDEFIKIINHAFLKKDREEWCQLFDQADIVYEKLAHMSEVTKDPQAWENNFLTEVTFPNNNTAILPTVPIQFSEYEVTKYIPSGKVGRDSLEILQKLGYSEAEFAELVEKKAIK